MWIYRWVFDVLASFGESCARQAAACYGTAAARETRADPRRHHLGLVNKVRWLISALIEQDHRAMSAVLLGLYQSGPQRAQVRLN